MDVQWKLWRRPPGSGRLSPDDLEHVAVDDPDPGTAHGYRTCRFGWTDDTSPTLILSWSCTRQRGHPGQHLAGTGDRVAAVHPQPSLRATATRVAV